MNRKYIYIFLITFIVACKPQSEKTAQINISSYNAYTQYAVFDYLVICDSLTRQKQNEKEVDSKNSLFIDGSSINVKAHSNFYLDTKRNPLLSKIYFYFAHDSAHNACLTQSVLIGQILAGDIENVKDMLNIKFASKKAVPIFTYQQASDSTYFDLIALINNEPVLKISNKDIDKIVIQKAHSITDQLAVFTGEKPEETDFTISFKLNSSFISQIAAIKSDSMSKLFTTVDFYNKNYTVELNIDEFKKSKEIELANIFTKEEVEGIKEQYSVLIKN